MTSRQRIDASREIRLWVGQLICAAGVGLAIWKNVPEAREWCHKKWTNVKEAVQIIKR